MPLETLTLESLAKFDFGRRVTEQFQQLIAEATADMCDRPSIAKARKVSLTLHLTPVFCADSGTCAEVKVVAAMDRKLPGYTSAEYTAEIQAPNNKARGMIRFRLDSPDNPNQRTFEDFEDEKHPESED